MLLQNNTLSWWMSVYNICGKTMEKLRKRVDARLVIIAKDYQKLVVKPIFVWKKIFSKNNFILSAVHKIKEPLILN